MAPLDDGGSPAHDTAAGTLASDVAEQEATPQRWAVVWWFGIGVACALVGLLPWFLTGMRLPLQNLWATSASPESMPIVFLPFSQYMLALIVGLIVTGSAVAGVVARATRERHPKNGLRAILAGVLLVHVAAAAQTTVVVMNGLQRSTWADVYLAALIAVTVVSVVTGILILLLVAKAPVAGATVGLGLAAVAVGPWVSLLVFPVGSVPSDLTSWMLSIVRWVPALIVGVVLAWSGFHTVGRIIAGVGLLLVLWVGPAVFTAVSAAAGTRVLAGDPRGMLEFGLQVFGGELWTPEQSLPPLILAVMVAVVGWFVRRLLRVRREAGAQALHP
ncbi:hypothetical protein [Salinibacterium sp. ZJ454]|uniref:hypothetical protein n=1 Tax=Salinibacterium sp. ZJ454 TaxID=2708339 RepID=UPI00142341F9|nr:hypothetical protein [Salinibacterium sp. ZJ454]